MARAVDYAHLNINLFGHPKVIGVLDEGGAEAFTGWIALLLWARDQADPDKLSEAGVVTEVIARRVLRGISEADPGFILAVLEKHGLLDHMLDGRWYLHDFTEHQHLGEWAARLERNRKGGQARAAQMKAQVRAGSAANAEPMVSLGSAPSQPNPTQTHIATPYGVAKNTLEPFEQFWVAYPRHIAKAAARAAFTRAVKSAPAVEITSGAERFAGQCQRENREIRFIPHPTTWLNQRRWEDDAAADSRPDNAANEVAPW